jgi:putative endonuclease
MKFYVYIIYSEKLNKFYIGYTSDLQKRLVDHNSGISAFTAKANDWILKYNEVFDSRETAMKREKELKNKKSRKYIEWIIDTVR